MLHGTRRYGTQMLSFEKRKAPKDRVARVVAYQAQFQPRGGRTCSLCGAIGHVEFQCPIPIDPPTATDGPIGLIGAIPKQGPAPAEYRGPGRVIFLPRGVFGEDLAAAKITDAARVASKAARSRRAQGAARRRWSNR